MATKKPPTQVMRPVYEFRLLPDDFRGYGSARRYADGAWIPDEGEYDVAFINDGFGAPICKYIEHGHQLNIVAGWCTGHWSANEPRHPRSNAWHYALADGATEWGGDWGRERNFNYVASRKGMDKLCSERHCANGHGISLTDPLEPHILAGLVRDRETKEVFTFPSKLICMYCKDEFKSKEPS